MRFTRFFVAIVCAAVCSVPAFGQTCDTYLQENELALDLQIGMSNPMPVEDGCAEHADWVCTSYLNNVWIWDCGAANGPTAVIQHGVMPGVDVFDVVTADRGVYVLGRDTNLQYWIIAYELPDPGQPLQLTYRGLRMITGNVVGKMDALSHPDGDRLALTTLEANPPFNYMVTVFDIDSGASGITTWPSADISYGSAVGHEDPLILGPESVLLHHGDEIDAHDTSDMSNVTTTTYPKSSFWLASDESIAHVRRLKNDMGFIVAHNSDDAEYAYIPFKFLSQGTLQCHSTARTQLSHNVDSVTAGDESVVFYVGGYTVRQYTAFSTNGMIIPGRTASGLNLIGSECIQNEWLFRGSDTHTYVYDITEFNGEDHVLSHHNVFPSVGDIAVPESNSDFCFWVTTGTQGTPFLNLFEGESIRALYPIGTQADAVAAYASGSDLYVFVAYSGDIKRYTVDLSSGYTIVPDSGNWASSLGNIRGLEVRGSRMLVVTTNELKIYDGLTGTSNLVASTSSIPPVQIFDYDIEAGSDLGHGDVIVIYGPTGSINRYHAAAIDGSSIIVNPYSSGSTTFNHHDIVPMSGNRWMFVQSGNSESVMYEITWDGISFNQSLIDDGFGFGDLVNREWSRVVAQGNTLFMVSKDYFSVHDWDPVNGDMTQRFILGGTAINECEIVNNGSYFFVSDNDADNDNRNLSVYLPECVKKSFDDGDDRDVVVAAPTGAFGASLSPNPFNPEVTVSFNLPRTEHASVAVYDLAGRRVRVLASGTLQSGPQSLSWNGRDDRGNTMASGTYFMVIQQGQDREVKKALMVK